MERWLVCWEQSCYSEGPSTSEQWPDRNFMTFSKDLHLEQNKLVQHSGLGTKQLESSFAEEDLRVWVDNKLFTEQHHALVTTKSSCILICTRKSLVRKSRDTVTPLCLAHLTPHLVTVSSCEPPSARKRQTEASPAEATKMVAGLEHMRKRWKELGSFSLEKRKTWWKIFYQYWKGC